MTLNDVVYRCTICLENRPANQKEPMMSHTVPDRPWQTAATDLFAWNNDTYIVIVELLSLGIKAIVRHKSLSIFIELT